jgi:hypothetical protein
METTVYHALWVSNHDPHQSSRAARDHVHVLFFVCSVNPYNLQAQAMSGIGVGSNEMHSALVDNGQLQPLNVMLNDLKTKIGYVTSYHNLR